EAEARADHVRDLLAGFGRNQDIGGVAGHHLHQHEYDERRAEQDRHGVEHAACDEEPHECPTPSLRGAKRRSNPGRGLGPWIASSPYGRLAMTPTSTTRASGPGTSSAR